MGALPNVFSRLPARDRRGARHPFDAAWALALPEKPGLTVTEMVEAFSMAGLAVLYVLGEDLAMTEPDVTRARRCLERANFSCSRRSSRRRRPPSPTCCCPGRRSRRRRGRSRTPSGACSSAAPPSRPPATPVGTVHCGRSRHACSHSSRVPPLCRPPRRLGLPRPAQIMEEVAAPRRCMPASITPGSRATLASSGRCRTRITPARPSCTSADFPRGG